MRLVVVVEHAASLQAAMYRSCEPSPWAVDRVYRYESLSLAESSAAVCLLLFFLLLLCVCE